MKRRWMNSVASATDSRPPSCGTVTATINSRQRGSSPSTTDPSLSTRFRTSRRRIRRRTTRTHPLREVEVFRSFSKTPSSWVEHSSESSGFRFMPLFSFQCGLWPAHERWSNLPPKTSAGKIHKLYDKVLRKVLVIELYFDISKHGSVSQLDFLVTLCSCYRRNEYC